MMEPVEAARLVLDDHPHLDRLWWRVDSVDEGVIISSVEPVESGWTVLERVDPPEWRRDAAFGRLLKRDRQAAGLTMRQLGDLCGCGLPHISKVEAGTQRASDELIGRLAAAVGQDGDVYLLVAGRLPLWLAEMFAESPAAWLMLLRQRQAIGPDTL